MSLYRKKPMVVDAEQWFPGRNVRGVIEPGGGGWTLHHVKTGQGQLVALLPGDWIIAEPDGSGYYPCRADLFEKGFEAIT